MIRNNRKTLLAAVFILLSSSTAFALQSDRNQPIQIEADQGSLDQKNQNTTFSGNVIVKQGTLYIQAGSVTVSKDKNGQQHMSARGNPVKFGQQLDKNGKVDGQANQVEYSSATGIVKLTGNAKITRGGDMASGNIITYNTRTEVYTVSGNKNATSKTGRRVSVVIQPNQ